MKTFLPIGENGWYICITSSNRLEVYHEHEQEKIKCDYAWRCWNCKKQFPRELEALAVFTFKLYTA